MILKSNETTFEGIIFTLKDGSTQFVKFNKLSMNPDYEMLGEKILLEVLEEKRASGIIDNTKELPTKGKVLLVGPGTDTITMTLQPGNEVLFPKYQGTDVELDGKKFLIMGQSDVLMVTKK